MPTMNFKPGAGGAAAFRRSAAVILIFIWSLTGSVTLAATDKVLSTKDKALSVKKDKTKKEQKGNTPAPITSTIWISTAGSYYREMPRIDQFITDVRTLPFSEIIIQVRADADAYYNSKLVPKAAGIPDSLDPLARMLKIFRARPNPRRVVAWFAPYHAGNINNAMPLPASHALTAHPDWVSVRADGGKTDKDGNLFLEPGLPEVQQHLEAAVKELVGNYPIDGIYFDPLADPDDDWGYHPAVLQEWQRQSGKQEKPVPTDPAWIAFRADLIGRALGGLARAAREARPTIAVSVGARTDGPAPASAADFQKTVAYARHHQDWLRWMRRGGLLNQLYLKDFKPEISFAEDFNGWMDFTLKMGRGLEAPVTIGVGGYLNESIDALAQLRRAAEAGARGLALADYEQPVRDSGTRALFMNAVDRTVFSPDYLQTMAELSENSRMASPPPGPAAAAGVTKKPAVTPEPPKKVAQAEETPTTEEQKPAGEFELPPPPINPKRIPAGDQDTAKPGVEEAEGKLIPAQGEGASSAPSAGTDQDETMKALRKLTGKDKEAKKTEGKQAKPAKPVEPAEAARPAAPLLTRREMLNELINDPRFAQSREWTLLRPDEQAKEYLKKNFGNIF